MTRSLALLSLLLFAPAAAGASITLISELLVDAPGSDDGQTFVELSGEGGASLDGYRVVARNGFNGAITHDVDLAGLVIPADGFFVVADSSGGATDVANADLLVASLDFQNGPDSVELVLDGDVVDAIGYGSFDAGDFFFGEGDAAPQPGPGESLARVFADVDTDDNAADFQLLDVPTPGTGVLFGGSESIDPPPPASVPEPATWMLVALGGVAIAGRAGSVRRQVRQTPRPSEATQQGALIGAHRGVDPSVGRRRGATQRWAAAAGRM